MEKNICHSTYKYKICVSGAAETGHCGPDTFSVAEAFTGRKGKYVRLKDSIESFKRVVAGEFDHIPEQCFYMAGGIEDVVEAHEKMKATV